MPTSLRVAPRHVYFAESVGERQVRIKIGASRDVHVRLRGQGLRFLGAIPEAGTKRERALHRRFARHALGGEFFRDAPEIRAFIQRECVHRVPSRVMVREIPTDPRKLMSVEQVAAHFRVSDRTVRRWLVGNDMPHRRIGRTIRFNLNEVEEWSSSRRAGVSPEHARTMPEIPTGD